MLTKALVETFYRSSSSLMSPLNKTQELQSIIVAFALSLSILLVLTGWRPRFSSSSYQRAIQTALKGLLESRILAQAEPQERRSKLNGIVKTPGVHHTPLQPLCYRKQLCNNGFNTSSTKQSQADGLGQVHASFEEFRRFPSFYE